jgi:DNA repair ATPase RecN
MTIVLKREPGRETEPLSAVLQRAGGPGDLSQEAKDHFNRVETITAGALKDLEEVAADVEKLREEIIMRATMIAEATIRLDELQRKAGTAYGTIRNAIEMIRQEFADIPATAPELDDMTNQRHDPVL